MKGIARLALYASLPALTACGSAPFPTYELQHDAPVPKEIQGDYLEYAPRPMRIVERVTVQYGDRMSTTSFCGLVFPPASLYLQGFADWGGGNFALSRNREGVRKYNMPRAFPQGLLEDALLEGKGRAFLPPPGHALLPVELAKGEVALAAKDGSREVIVRTDDSRAIIECGRDGEWLSTVWINAWFRDEDGRPVCPQEIVVEGIGQQYKVWIQVLSWDSADESEEEFQREFDRRFRR